MTVIVTDTGFAPDTWTGNIVAYDAAATDVAAIDLPSDADPATLSAMLPDIEMIRVNFPDFADGRGFTIAQRLRRLGYTGRLRACGHVIADQYAMARRAGFDEVEIDDALATRQPQNQWVFRADWRANDYQSRLRG